MLEHGGKLDHHLDLYGGDRSDWIDLSTGINNSPYPIPKIPKWVWECLPDERLNENFKDAARDFWKVPKSAEITTANGTSPIISILPSIFRRGNIDIYHPTYNEYKAAFTKSGWKISKNNASARVLVNPNNPDGKYWSSTDILSNDKLTIVDESFCDLTPEKSLIKFSDQPGVVVLKSFGKFWGLAGLRLGCAIAAPKTLKKLQSMLGPWPASGPALFIGVKALNDKNWANNNVKKLDNLASKFDDILLKNSIHIMGGTSLFRLIKIKNAEKMKNYFAQNHILIRTFSYSNEIARIGIPKNEKQRLKIETILNEFEQ